jgi:DNA-binding MarR family transcriptional regulator
MARTGRDISLLFDLFAVYQRVGGLVAAALDGAGLSGDEYAVYSVLFDLGPLTATEMAGHLGMPLTTVLDHLRAMDRRRHIVRVPHPADGRARQVRLSPAGLAAHRRAHAAWEQTTLHSLCRSIVFATPSMRSTTQSSPRSRGWAPAAGEPDVAPCLGHGRPSAVRVRARPGSASVVPTWDTELRSARGPVRL